jgi:hypothetical protein
MTDQFMGQRQPKSGCACWDGSDQVRGSPKTSLDYDNDDDDVALAKELFELSVQEREKVFDDIHGVGNPEETPEFVAGRLAQLDVALALISRAKRKAFDRAIFFKPSMSQDRKFKLMFLRADCFDATKAAERMAKYFKVKLSLFGEAKLAKRITLDDLSDEDRADLRLKTFHKNDPVGRPVWFFDFSEYFNKMGSNALEGMVRSYVHVVIQMFVKDTHFRILFCSNDILVLARISNSNRLDERVVRCGI